jgi:ribonucleoside-diphosphate reductase alpha chain
LFKERVETGNIYLFHEENVNEPSMLNEYIPSSNLCTEITLPSSASKEIETYFDPENPEIIINKKNAGDISLCNLASINLLNYFSSDTKTKKNITNLIIRALDNTIDIAMYPVIEAQKTNQNFRYLGVGILNLTNYLATKKIIIDSKEALEENHKIMDEISYELINSSADLAIERGAFNNFKKTK